MMGMDENPELLSQIPPSSMDRRAEALGDLCVLPDELLCAVLASLPPRDVARLACVSSVMYILCNEEPLWMNVCLNNVNCQLEYKGSWKKTAIHQLGLLNEYEEAWRKPLYFSGGAGFNSMFLLRRLYRCYTALHGFSFDTGNVERKHNLSLEEFHKNYDGQKPVLITGLADTWPARNTWTIEQLQLNYGDTTFRISQKSSCKIRMKFKDYASYMKIQHDEDPLYIFDEKFGEVAPGLLKDYTVPHLFQEDFFDILDINQRPPFRWLIIGPERSGASWHVDPSLTSAWNTLICGRKRWALYPPGRVPLGVTVHVNEEDGDVNIDTPSSLQWWLDFYPFLAEEDKPIECTQLPGETIFVPSGWWHCVLNLENTVAVTQNFVNSKNFEFVCLDMAPGYQHKGVCRAGLLAVDKDRIEELKRKTSCISNNLSFSDLSRQEKRIRTSKPEEDLQIGNATKGGFEHTNLGELEFSYDINFLSMFLDEERDHYNSLWSFSNSIGQREMRDWLYKLWVGKPRLRDLIWKGACLALNAGRWSERLAEICSFHELPSPTDDERLPVGTGSNPVYLVADSVIKIFVEGGLEASLHCLGTELEFYRLLQNIDSPLKSHIPDILACGILFLDNGSCTAMSWDGKGLPEVVANCNIIPEKCQDANPFGLWSKVQFEYRKAGKSLLVNSCRGSTVWPYVVTKRCRGKIFADVRDVLSGEETLELAAFLGEQLRNLHLVPCPALNDKTLLDREEKTELSCGNGLVDKTLISAEWKLFIRLLNKRKKNVANCLIKWGDPIPRSLIEKVYEYLPDDLTKFIIESEHEKEVFKSFTWIHSDVMDDNIHMEPYSLAPCSVRKSSDAILMYHENVKGPKNEQRNWHPTHILDFSDLLIGDPIYDLIPIHLDVFRGDSGLLKRFLECYKLPLMGRKQTNGSTDNSEYQRLSYQAMCYCILHEENVLGAIFSLWEDLRMATSWEEVEKTVWGDLNNYTSLF